jgi:acetolactate synthase I/II/III large subunit
MPDRIAEADLVFFVGSKTGSQVTHSWHLPSAGTPVIHCDIAADVIGLNYPNSSPLVGDAKRTVELLLDELSGPAPAAHSAWTDRVRAITDEWRAEWTPLLESEAVPIRPERLCSELTAILPSDALLVSDTGHAGMWTAGMVDLRYPDQDYVRAAGSLGWAFPAALGAKCAVPDRPVVAFTGDGGLWYHIAELETAARWGINAVIVVNNNHSLNQEIGLWADAYEGSLHGRHGEMWQFNEVDFSAIAREMGAAGFRVEKPGELSGTLKAALTANKPAVVEVVTEISAVAPKAYTP